MDVIAALIVFSAIGAFICAKSRAAGPALFFGVVAVVLLCTTPIGSGIPDAVAAVAGWVGDQGSDVAQASTTR